MTPRLWAVVVLFFGAIVTASYITSPTVVTLPPPAGPTVSVLPSAAPVQPMATTTAPVQEVAITSVPKAKTKASTVAKKAFFTPSLRVLPPQPTQAEFDATAALVRGALVNILCFSGRADIPSISGSGVIIDAKGIVITNAHIAQYFLYTGDSSLSVSCWLRTGSPAQNAYRARLIFISPMWVAANASILSNENPTGNGENDFALLAINGSAGVTPLPTTFPFIPLGEGNAYVGEPVVIGSYGAQFLTTPQIQSSLFPTIVFGTIKAVFTFIQTSVDVITIGGSAAAQEGSSGGGIARVPGTLEGIVTTSTTEGVTANRTLGGITASYIRHDYEIESGITFSTMLATTPIISASNFAGQIPGLRAQLTAGLSH